MKRSTNNIADGGVKYEPCDPCYCPRELSFLKYSAQSKLSYGEKNEGEKKRMHN